MDIQLLRHATLVLRFPGRTLLLDPMLSAAGAMEPVANAGNSQRIPLVELPVRGAELDQLLAGLDAIVVTHTHRDHWDAAASSLLSTQLPLFCQPADTGAFEAAGFAPRPVGDSLDWGGLSIHRTGGRHGNGEVGRKMGAVSGFVFEHPATPTLYVTGDTVWCPEVQNALERWRPDIVVVNAGQAEFLSGGPITMSAEDVASACFAAPTARIIAVHFETVNHCRLTREALRAYLASRGMEGRVRIPPDGEVMSF